MNLKYLYSFILIDLTPVTLEKIHSYFGDFEKAWRSSSSEWRKINLQEKTIHKILTTKQKINPETEWQKLSKSEIGLISIQDKEYPSQLKEIKSPPQALFYQGNISLLKMKQLAVVGTRRYTAYGKMVTEKLIPEIATAGIIITSGMAQGIDSLAHQSAINNQQPTIAVLGSGLTEAGRNGYSRKMLETILAHNGLIISEYQPLYSASRYTFPARNRIVSGLSLGTLVIEAGIKSGTLITAGYALEQNREVFAVPGNIFSEKSAGTHQLIKDGAQVVTSADDILETFNFAPRQKTLFEQSDIKFDNREEELIYKKLSLDPLTIDKLSILCKLPIATVTTTLSLLEMKGLAKNIGGGRFIKG